MPYIQVSVAVYERMNIGRVPPLGLEEVQQSSGKAAHPENHCADPCATSSNPEQLAAMLRNLDRSELEQLLLTLLSKAESASE